MNNQNAKTHPSYHSSYSTVSDSTNHSSYSYNVPTATPCAAPYLPFSGTQYPLYTMQHEFFLASISSFTLTDSPHYFSYTPHAHSTGLVISSSSMTFMGCGNYIMQLSLSIMTSSHYIGPGIIFINTHPSRGITLSPPSYTSSSFTCHSTQSLILFNTLINVSMANSTLSLSSNFSTSPHSGTLTLGMGSIFCYQLT